MFPFANTKTTTKFPSVQNEKLHNKVNKTKLLWLWFFLTFFYCLEQQSDFLSIWIDLRANCIRFIFKVLLKRLPPCFCFFLLLFGQDAYSLFHLGEIYHCGWLQGVIDHKFFLQSSSSNLFNWSVCEKEVPQIFSNIDLRKKTH